MCGLLYVPAVDFRTVDLSYKLKNKKSFEISQQYNNYYIIKV